MCMKLLIKASDELVGFGQIIVFSTLKDSVNAHNIFT